MADKPGHDDPGGRLPLRNVPTCLRFAVVLQLGFALRALCSPVPMGAPTASRSLVETSVLRVRRQRAYGGLHAATSAAASFRWLAIGVGGGG